MGSEVCKSRNRFRRAMLLHPDIDTFTKLAKLPAMFGRIKGAVCFGRKAVVEVF